MTGPERQGTCGCGCGQLVTGSRYGRRKRYADTPPDHSHRQRAYRQRAAWRAASAARDPSGAPVSEPGRLIAAQYGWRPGTGWPDDESFRRYLEAG